MTLPLAGLLLVRGDRVSVQLTGPLIQTFAGMFLSWYDDLRPSWISKLGIAVAII